MTETTKSEHKNKATAEVIPPLPETDTNAEVTRASGTEKVKQGFASVLEKIKTAVMAFLKKVRLAVIVVAVLAIAGVSAWYWREIVFT